MVQKAFVLCFFLWPLFDKTLAQNSSLDHSRRAGKTNAVSPDASSGVQQTNMPAFSDEIIFLMLQVAKDSVTGNTGIYVMDHIRRPGKLKSEQHSSAMMPLPFLSFVFYKGSMPVDSFRMNHPLTERIQNTRADIQGYQDREVESRELFVRFQKREADKLRIYIVTATSKQEARTVEL